MSLFVALTLLGLTIGGQAQEPGAKVYARVADSVLLMTVENDQGKVHAPEPPRGDSAYREIRTNPTMPLRIS